LFISFSLSSYQAFSYRKTGAKFLWKMADITVSFQYGCNIVFAVQYSELLLILRWKKLSLHRVRVSIVFASQF